MIGELPCETLCRKCDPEAIGGSHRSQIGSIDEGIEILTGVRAGERLPDIGFEADTVNFLVDKRLSELAERLATFGKKDEKENDQ